MFGGVHFDQNASDFDELSWKTFDNCQLTEYNIKYFFKNSHALFPNLYRFQPTTSLVSIAGRRKACDL